MELNGLWPQLIMPALIQVNEQSQSRQADNCKPADNGRQNDDRGGDYNSCETTIYVRETGALSKRIQGAPNST